MRRGPGRIITRPRYQEPNIRRTAVKYASVGAAPSKSAALVNIWSTSNVDGNVGTNIDATGATIQFPAPAQVLFGWEGAPAGGETHQLEMSTGDVTGDYTIVGRVNTGNVLVATATMGANQTVVITIPTAGAETGWSLFSDNLSAGRLTCFLYRV